MVEFTMNSIVSATTGFAPFKTNGTMPHMISKFKEQQTVPGVDIFINTIWDNLMIARALRDLNNYTEPLPSLSFFFFFRPFSIERGFEIFFF